MGNRGSRLVSSVLDEVGRLRVANSFAFSLFDTILGLFPTNVFFQAVPLDCQMELGH